ncbi:Protein FAM222B [Camelus dromedarius]|uniref:Protein FAM222B n=1 Tax=Camelus dromedarius TaxID=9838 RepID=A0A5N4BX24_CAMDR|nr:Protein FAM222B [Camelus dromedarius]
MPDSDDPLNVTGSTSTIALSMAATLQQSQPLDLSCIVQQINQVCQTRAGISTASVCEGQLADPSPSSHSLLINANTQVSTHSVPTPVPYVCHPGEANPIPTVNGLAALLAYPSGHYFQPLWNNVLATPKSNSSGSHDLAMRFHGGHPAGTPFDCAGAAGAHHRAVAWGGPVASQNSLMQTVDYLSGDVQQACFREQSLAMLSKAHRAPGNRALIL